MENELRIDLINAAATLSGTRAVDGNGNLLVLHHMTNKDFNVFEKSNDMGFHFGSIGQAEKRKRIMISRGEAEADEAWNCHSCLISVCNPVIIADDPGIWNPRWLTATFHVFLNGNDKDKIRTCARLLSARTKGAPFSPEDEECLRTWFRVLVGALKRAGHDGIVYRNVFESTGRAIEWSWLVFDDSQIVKLGNRPDLSALPPFSIPTGKPLKLKGAAPMRHHQPYGIGRLVRKGDVSAFREAVLNWAAARGLEWERNYPLDYQPSFGEGRPSHDLVAKIGEDQGIRIAVNSFNGYLVLQPFSSAKSCTELMAHFRSDASEGFFDHGLPSQESHETVCWRAAETLGTFIERLEALYEDAVTEFLPRPDLRL